MALFLCPAVSAQGQQSATSSSQEDTYKKAVDAFDRRDEAAALKAMQSLAEQGYVPAQTWLAMYLRRQQQYAEAVPLLRKAADADNAEAQFLLGISYLKGQGVAQDDKEAFRWYRRAAEHGLAPAEHLVGAMYEEGRGVALDYNESARWFRRAADRGYAEAQCRLGVAYEFGRGVPQDNIGAVGWYRKSAEQGNGPCQFRLATMYRDHVGVAKDDKTALQWFTKAADQDYAPALSAIGRYYVEGKVLNRDPGKARDYFLRASAQNDPDDQGHAEGMLGAMYQTGSGVAVDHAEAMKWFLKSAERGNNQSMFEIGLDYEKGVGQPADFGKAVTWYQKAVEAGNADAKQRLAQLSARTQGSKPDRSAKPTIPGALQARCFLEVDVDGLRDSVPQKVMEQRHNDCLRRNWKRLFGSEPFPLDQ